jgi:GST-like protein
MLEELLALGHKGAEYDAWLININKGDQFSAAGMSRSIRTPRFR